MDIVIFIEHSNTGPTPGNKKKLKLKFVCIFVELGSSTLKINEKYQKNTKKLKRQMSSEPVAKLIKRYNYNRVNI